MSGTVDYKCIVDLDDLDVAEECVREPQLRGSPEVLELASRVVARTLIAGGGGADSYIHVLPDRFLFKLMNLNLI